MLQTGPLNFPNLPKYSFSTHLPIVPSFWERLQVFTAVEKKKIYLRLFFFFQCFCSGFYCYLKKGLSTSHWENVLFGIQWFLCLLEWKITHHHNTEKYYCQRFWDAVSLSIRSASMWSLGFFIVLVVGNIVHLQWAPQQNLLSHVVTELSSIPKCALHGRVCIYKDRNPWLKVEKGVDDGNLGDGRK